MRKTHLTVSLLMVFFTVTISMAMPSKVETVKNVDLDRYAGTWYEIARIPNQHEKGMVEVTSTLKRVGKKKYELINTGCKGSKRGKRTTIRGKVDIPDSKNTGSLKVKVFLFTVNYKILAIDRDYNYALVTSDEGKHLWIFSKSPVINSQQYDNMVDCARQKGFDVARLEKVTQASNSAYAEK